MKKQYIQQLVEKFFDGNTSLKEEHMLYDYFRGKQIDPDLAQFSQFFSDMSCLCYSRDLHHTKNINIALRWAMGVAATMLLAVSSMAIWQKYQYNQFANTYAGSYMIVNGERIDNLQDIRSDIENTMAEANKIKQYAQDYALASEAKQDILNGISSPSERDRIAKLLNE